MKRFMICLFVCCIGMTVFAGPRDRRGGHRPPPPRHGHRHGRNDGLYIANGVLGIVDKSFRILAGPRPVVVTQPVYTTPPVVVQQPPVVVQQPQPVVVQQPTTQIIQVGNTQYVIFTDGNGKRRAVPINQ